VRGIKDKGKKLRAQRLKLKPQINASIRTFYINILDFFIHSEYDKPKIKDME